MHKGFYFLYKSQRVWENDKNFKGCLRFRTISVGQGKGQARKMLSNMGDPDGTVNASMTMVQIYTNEMFSPKKFDYSGA